MRTLDSRSGARSSSTLRSRSSAARRRRPRRPGGQPPPGGRGGGRGRGAVQVMTLTSSAWPDGGQIPAKYTQAGDECRRRSRGATRRTASSSFVLIVHDVDAAIGNGTDDMLHWMLWNIPGDGDRVHERVPHGSQLPDGTRQISATGPYYRGPAALAVGSGAPLRVRTVRARYADRRPGGRRVAPADARGGRRRDGRPHSRQGGVRRPVQATIASVAEREPSGERGGVAMKKLLSGVLLLLATAIAFADQTISAERLRGSIDCSSSMSTKRASPAPWRWCCATASRSTSARSAGATRKPAAA